MVVFVIAKRAKARNMREYWAPVILLLDERIGRSSLSLTVCESEIGALRITAFGSAHRNLPVLLQVRGFQSNALDFSRQLFNQGSPDSEGRPTDGDGPIKVGDSDSGFR